MRSYSEGSDQRPGVAWGIVGPGRIAAKVVQDFGHVPGARAVGVASRSAERAEAFAAEHGLERAYGSYASIIADPEIDVLYIATPHPQHHAIALAAIEAGKSLLVEKTFTATVAGAEEIATAAQRRGRVRDGGHVDPFPAGHRRRAGARRRRRDR